jgi:hypothetical protein
LYRDVQIGGHPVPDGSLIDMLVSEERRKSAGYLSHLEYDEHNVASWTPHGTVFFVGIDNGYGATFIYAITACHCVKPYEPTEALQLEIQGHSPIKTLQREWLQSKVSDVACRRVREPLLVKWVPLNEFVESTDVSALRAGHDVYIVGLFTEATHRLDNREVDPVVRFGKISNPLVEVPVYLDPRKMNGVNDATRIKAHLIESISFGGESGSPVFLYKQHVKTYRRKPHSHLDLTPPLLESEIREDQIKTPLLGLVSSHWPLTTEVTKGTRKKSLGDVGLNSGIAIVAYAQHIRDLLMDKNLEKERLSTPPRIKVPTPLSKKNPARKDNGITKEEFIDSLKRVSRRIQPLPPDGEKSGT